MGDGGAHPKFLISNSDEMEPGAFKDRMLMERNPHQLIEGMIIAAYAIEADMAYIFLRWEYHRSAEIMATALREAYGAGYLGNGIAGSRCTASRCASIRVPAVTSAGRKRPCSTPSRAGGPSPRAKPPFPQSKGLWGNRRS